MIDRISVVTEVKSRGEKAKVFSKDFPPLPPHFVDCFLRKIRGRLEKTEIGI